MYSVFAAASHETDETRQIKGIGLDKKKVIDEVALLKMKRPKMERTEVVTY